MCLVDITEEPGLYREVHSKARRTHQCGECRRFIQVGERYMRVTSMTDGFFTVGKFCAQCETTTRLLGRYCGGAIFGEVEADLREHVRPDVPWRMRAARAVVGMRRQWRRFDGTGLMHMRDALP